MSRPFVLALLLCLAAPAARAEETGCIAFGPDEASTFTIRNVGAAISSVVGFWNYWYGENSVTLDSVPRDAQLEVFYIRKNFQKKYQLLAPPVRLCLPNRISATRRDALTVRVSSGGYSTREWTFSVLDTPENLVLQLDPLPNALVFLGHTHLRDRTTLALRTLKEPEFRVSKSTGQAGFTLALTQTADKLAPKPRVSGGHVRGVEVAQVGEDLLLRIDTDSPDVEARSKQSYDPIRQEYVFLLDFAPAGERAPSMDEVRVDLERAPFSPGDRCAGAMEATLRSRLEAEVIARAHRPSGSLADLYQRQAMLKLGRFDHGTVQTLAGETLRTGNPLELEMALQGAASVRGYLGLLAAFSRTQPESETALRSLIAPDMSAEEFAPIWQSALAACGG
jgi:hypothetical protein